MTRPLTDKKVEALKYSGKPQDIRDGIVPGLFVRLRASKKVFMVAARDRSGTHWA